MKKVVLLLLLLFSIQITFADTVVQMESYGGVYRIPCLVNGAKMKFIFDTGASSVCLSMSMAEYLYDNGYIAKEDIIGTGTSSVADGRIVDHIKLRLKDIQIGNLHISNVEAVVIDGQNAPLLLGQSAIKKLGTIEIKEDKLIIHDGKDAYDFSKLHEELEISIENRTDNKSLGIFKILDENERLYDVEKFSYALHLFNIREYDKGITILNKIDDINQLFIEYNKNTYEWYGNLYYAKNDYSNAIHYYKLGLEKFKLNILDQAYINSTIGDCYATEEMDGYNEAKKYFSKAFSLYAKANKVTETKLWSICKSKITPKTEEIRTTELDLLVCHIIVAQYESDEITASKYASLLEELQKCDNKYASAYLELFNKNY
ncbi:MAG: TIGR02281 family clan AA aspartic protease [Muribaculaceae bacterium]|nr:TIGR02281 family clan AA aspartic protease [Muribaculaceae bacterium]